MVGFRNPTLKYMMQFTNLSWAICRNIARKRTFINTPNLVPGFYIIHCFRHLKIYMMEHKHSFQNFNNSAAARVKHFIFGQITLKKFTLLINFIEAERDSKWTVHLECLQQMAVHLVITSILFGDQSICWTC